LASQLSDGAVHLVLQTRIWTELLRLQAVKTL